MFDVATIKLIAFDADDTLWDCQGYFDKVEAEYTKILEPYWRSGQPSPGDALFAVETANMPLLGYGCKAFTISLVENAVNYSHGEITATAILRILDLGKSLLRLPATPLERVAETLKALRDKHKYTFVVFTKGELLDQENKLRRSGLAPCFDDVVVVSDKTSDSYQRLCSSHSVSIEQMAMVGNSFKSDISPVLTLGGAAVYVPSNSVWKHEEMATYEHSRLVTIERFSELLSIF